MRRSVLLAALMIGLAGPVVASAAEQPRQAGRHVQSNPAAQPDVRFAGPAWRPEGWALGWTYGGPWWRRSAPWSFSSYDPCARSWCPPPYFSYWDYRAALRAVPLAAVLARLRKQDYHDFSSAFLQGANYDIIARNRYGQAVRLIVNAGNGQIRRILQ